MSIKLTYMNKRCLILGTDRGWRGWNLKCVTINTINTCKIIMCRFYLTLTVQFAVFILFASIPQLQQTDQIKQKVTYLPKSFSGSDLLFAFVMHTLLLCVLVGIFLVGKKVSYE